MNTHLFSLKRIFETLGINPHRSEQFLDSLPFTGTDVTAGSETELQTVVLGSKDTVDLPQTILRSHYYANIMRRAASGDLSPRALERLNRFLDENDEQTWENSWVRIPAKCLSRFATQVFTEDMLADKSNPLKGSRSDINRFTVHEGGRGYMRIPVSYVLKLALADVIGAQRDCPTQLTHIGTRLMRHFLNDNTSPESFSFHVVSRLPDKGLGAALARETSKRFLFMQLLIQYANLQLGLKASGQHTQMYFSPQPPVRQKALNDSISDAFYRDLFMSPCLSGWDHGEVKHQYMHLCHQMLSRSQMNAVAKLREAGIVANNLVVLPNMSNTSLANNGVHVTLGSRRLTRALKNSSSGFTAAHEKYVGDLAIKTVEHFIPLFVGTYSAAPHRLAFTDFHPEKVLGFLPHELDYTHLRMMWRRWKKKASLSVFGNPITPFGPVTLDQIIGRGLQLRGDFLPDYRLIDYMVAIMGTEQSPAFDGRVGNHARLKQDLTELGVFDSRMAFYCLYRQREFAAMGFSGFEGRYYSLFESLTDDMAQAVNLQGLLTALAYRYMANGSLSHAHIPDDPFTESERRQIFFGTAIGIPTFFVRQDTRNEFLRKIISQTERVRSSRRYPGYWRVYNIEYRKALVRMLWKDAADLIEMLDLKDTMADLTERVEHPQIASAGGKLTRGILDTLGARSPLRVDATEFNLAAERYYRTTLRRKHMQEGLAYLEKDLQTLCLHANTPGYPLAESLQFTLRGQDPVDVFKRTRSRVLDETLSAPDIVKLLNLMMISLEDDRQHSGTSA